MPTGPVEIVDAIMVRLKTITTANGYDFDLTDERVQFGRALPATSPTLPSLWVSPGDWTEDEDGDGANLSWQMNETLTVAIECFAQASSQRPYDRWVAGTRLAEAVREALLGDRELGGLCYNLKTVAHYIAGGEFAAGDRGGVCEVKVSVSWQRGAT